jgi:recombination protein RecT
MEIQKIEHLMPKVEISMREMGFNVERIKQECLFALQIIKSPKNSFLQKATQESFISAVMNIAAIGLTLNPIVQEAYLIPRKRKEGDNYIIEAHLEPSYKGLINLICKSGIVTNVSANVIYENDYFDCNLGDNFLIHKPYFLQGKKESGNRIAAYAIGHLFNGGKQIEVMSISEIYEIRGTSESYKNNPDFSIWKTYEDEMIKKTVIKRLTKKFPRKEISNNLYKALELTNNDYEVKDWQITKIENLLINANMVDDEKERIEKNYNCLTFNTANQLIENLENNQLDPIDSGINYGQREINKKLNKHI